MDGGEHRALQHDTTNDYSATISTSQDAHRGLQAYNRDGTSNLSATAQEHNALYQVHRPAFEYNPLEFQQPSVSLHPENRMHDIGMQQQQYSRMHPRLSTLQQTGAEHFLQSYGQAARLPRVLPHNPYVPPSRHGSKDFVSSVANADQSTASRFPQQSTGHTGIGASQNIAPSINDSQDSSLPPHFASRHSHFSQPSSNYGNYQPSQLDQERRDGNGKDMSMFEEWWAYYDLHIKTAFEHIINERLDEARNTILPATWWLLSSVTQLGLHHDHADMYDERIAMWAELNHCWEALGLKQRDLTEQVQRTGQLQPNAYIMTSESIIDLINQFISMCDQVEQYGLVDYEMGIWEEQIVAIFISCLDVLKMSDNPPT